MEVASEASGRPSDPVVVDDDSGRADNADAADASAAAAAASTAPPTDISADEGAASLAPNTSSSSTAASIERPTSEDATVAESRKMVVRALDSKICEEEAPVALAAISTACTLVNNIITHPDETKYKKIRTNNPAIRKKLLQCPGAQDLLLALGFRTKVIEFEEFWIVDDSPVVHRMLADGLLALERYKELTETKIERNAKIRRERLANMNDDRAKVLADIEADKQARRDREEMRQRK